MKNKIIVIINGAPASGKDAFCDAIAKVTDTVKVSSIDPVKNIAMSCGWKGEKDDKSRNFLSHLKRLVVEFNDLPFYYVLGQINFFERGPAKVMFVHIREEEEIVKLKKYIQEHTYCFCGTLLIKRPGPVKKIGNPSDDLVETFDYDFVYYNTQPTLDSMMADASTFFLNTIIKGN